MEKITMKVDGMRCPMCESHVNDAVRNAFRVRSVKSSHKTGESVIVIDALLSEVTLRETVEKLGYRVVAVKREPYEKKGFFSFLHH